MLARPYCELQSFALASQAPCGSRYRRAPAPYVGARDSDSPVRHTRNHILAGIRQVAREDLEQMLFPTHGEPMRAYVRIPRPGVNRLRINRFRCDFGLKRWGGQPLPRVGDGFSPNRLAAMFRAGHCTIVRSTFALVVK